LTVAQLVFRDGPRDVPPHVEDILKGIEIHKMTYDEAIKAGNMKMENEYLAKHVNKMLSEHFRLGGG
jgi:hypothetical protein